MIPRQQIPNAITIARLVLAFGMFAILAVWTADSSTLWLDLANVIFALAAFSDFLDGYLARKWKVVSVFGRVVDPFVDKILVLGAFAYLTVIPASGVGPTVVVILTARELLVTALRSVIESRGGDFSADWTGKIKMALQCTAVIAALGYAAHHHRLDQTLETVALVLRNALIWGTVAITLLSGASYVRKAVRAGM